MQTTSYYCHVIMWHGRDLYYDGMGATKQRQLRDEKN